MTTSDPNDRLHEQGHLIYRTIVTFAILICLIPIPAFAISISINSGGGDGVASLTQRYNLDRSTELTERAILGEDTIQQDLSVFGQGNNNLAQKSGNGIQSVSYEVISSGSIRLGASTGISGDAVDLAQNLVASGETKASVSGSTGSSFGSQESWISSGFMDSTQVITAQESGVKAGQATGIAGAIGYLTGVASSNDKKVEVTGGLNGLGAVFSQMSTSASNKVSAQGEVRANSLESKAYSTIKATSSDADAYSYLSSGNLLHSVLAGSADEYVSAGQKMKADSDVLVYAGTASGSISRSHAEEGEKVSGSIIASSGDLQSVEKNLAGDAKSVALDSAPISGFNFYSSGPTPTVTRPAVVFDSSSNEHIFVRGGDGALYDNKNGNWYKLGGQFNLNPSALNDNNGNIHVFVRGNDNSLWDRRVTGTMGGEWNPLGGYITSSPSAVIEPGFSGWAAVAARGGDGALYIRDLYMDNTNSGSWSKMGGTINGDPFAVASLDGSGYIYTLTRGGDNSLWVNKADTGPTPVSFTDWYGYGGLLTSDLSGAIEPVANGFLKVAGRGGNDALWMCDIDLTAPGSPLSFAWSSLGGLITSDPYVVFSDADNIHTFVRGGDNSLYVNKGVWRNGVYEHNWYLLGGTITSDPTPAINPSNNNIDVAVRGGDGKLYLNVMNPNTETTINWRLLGGQLN